MLAQTWPEAAVQCAALAANAYEYGKTVDAITTTVTCGVAMLCMTLIVSKIASTFKD